MVARATARQCLDIGDEVVALTRQELDIADRDSVFASFALHLPDAVINCAAYTDVDGAESNPEASFAANMAGVRNLAEAARETNVRLVTISTDYVFDGANLGFYTEDDVPNPQGVYAISKYEGEVAAREANPDVVIVRSGWIYGEGGTNFLSVMHRLLSEGNRLKAIGDAFGTPTFATDLAQSLRELAARTETGIFHVTNSGDGTSYLGFAQKVCEIGGFDRGLLESVSNDDLKRPAPRPVSSKLASNRLEPLPEWTDALKRFLTVK
jgi:dTDP-4-dehydrorhamnose reductase